MDIEFPSKKMELRHQLSRLRTHEPKQLMKFEELRDNPIMRERLTEMLDRAFEGINIDDIDVLNEKITTTVKECVEEVCPKVDQIKKKEPWVDVTLQQELRELKSCTDYKETRKLQRKIKETQKRLKNEYYRELADNINTIAEAREVEKEFAMAKKYTAFKSGSKLQISNEKLKTHFENHFAARSPELPLPPELQNPEQYQHLSDEVVMINEEFPDEVEVKNVLKSFKNNKSAGTDKLKTEGLKYNDSKKLVDVILLLLTLIWTYIKVPTTWLHSSINCLFKKGLMGVAANYRGLSIGANMSRILAKVILSRFQKAYEAHISESQFGFRQNRSTSDGIFIVKMVTEKVGESLVAVYIDLTAAYDHIPRDFLFKVLNLRTGATHLVAILKKMYEGTTASIKGTKAIFDVLVGCRQGGQESPCLFNYYFDYVLKIAAYEINKTFPDGWGVEFEFNIPHTCTNRQQRQKGKIRGVEFIRWILYADDVVLFCKSVSEAEKLLNIINDTCNRFGLTVSFKKTKTQVFNNDELAKKSSLFSIQGNDIENVLNFTYLGHVITIDENNGFTEHHIASATSKFNELRKVLTDTNVHMCTRKKLLESCARSRLVYGTQASLPNEKQMKKLEACWYRILRNMIKGGWVCGESPDESEAVNYSFLYTNNEVQKVIKTIPLRDFIYSQHLKYIAHVCRGPNTLITKIMLFAKPTRRYYRNPWLKIAELLGITADQAKRLTQSRGEFAELVWQRFSSTS